MVVACNQMQLKEVKCQLKILPEQQRRHNILLRQAAGINKSSIESAPNRTHENSFSPIYRGVPYKSVSFGHWLTHIRVQHLWVRPHKSETFGLGLNHVRLQHFYMIFHVKCCTLMSSIPKPDVAFQCVSNDTV